MSANEFSVERVDSLNNIASATPATNEKDKRRRNRQRMRNARPGEAEASTEQDAGQAEAGPEGHIIDFEA
jgi:hypothetical protein